VVHEHGSNLIKLLSRLAPAKRREKRKGQTASSSFFCFLLLQRGQPVATPPLLLSPAVPSLPASGLFGWTSQPPSSLAFRLLFGQIEGSHEPKTSRWLPPPFFFFFLRQPAASSSRPKTGRQPLTDGGSIRLSSPFLAFSPGSGGNSAFFYYFFFFVCLGN
jgi:hypothetical protein